MKHLLTYSSVTFQERKFLPLLNRSIKTFNIFIYAYWPTVVRVKVVDGLVVHCHSHHAGCYHWQRGYSPSEQTILDEPWDEHVHWLWPRVEIHIVPERYQHIVRHHTQPTDNGQAEVVYSKRQTQTEIIFLVTYIIILQ